MNYCKYCYRILDDGAETCTVCGKPQTVKKKINACPNCGEKIYRGAAFCSHCGSSIQSDAQQTPKQSPIVYCSKCGSSNIDIQLHQENCGGSTVTRTKSHYREKGHGCLWWLIFGWWWWMVDLCIWIFAFPIRLLFQVFKKKKYVGNTSSVSSTSNRIGYKTIYLCKSCGHHWEK